MQTSTQSKTANPDQIASAAYQLWEQAGKPTGREMEFWLKAERQVTAAPRAQADNTVARDSQPKAPPSPSSPSPATTTSLATLEWKSGQPQIKNDNKGTTASTPRTGPVRDKRATSSQATRAR